MGGTAYQSRLIGSLGRLLDSALQLAEVRLGILGTEVALEKRRISNGLLRGAFAMLALDVGLMLLCGFVVLLVWDGYRLLALGGLALFFLCAGLLLMRQAYQRLHSESGLFEVSVAELKRDRAELTAVAHE